MARLIPFSPATVPTLDELVADPTRATGLPWETRQALLHRCVAVQTILLGALTAAPAPTPAPSAASQSGSRRMSGGRRARRASDPSRP